jgi:hypothetical protein
MATSKKNPTVTESIAYFKEKIQTPRIEFLARAQAVGALSLEECSAELLHLSNIEATMTSFRNFVDGEPQS